MMNFTGLDPSVYLQVVGTQITKTLATLRSNIIQECTARSQCSSVFCRTGEQHVGQSFWEPTNSHHGWTDVWSVYGNRIFWELHRLSLLLHWRHWRYSTFISKQYVLLLLEQFFTFCGLTLGIHNWSQTKTKISCHTCLPFSLHSHQSWSQWDWDVGSLHLFTSLLESLGSDLLPITRLPCLSWRPWASAPAPRVQLEHRGDQDQDSN